MPRKESLYPKDWFRIGEKEIQRAENLLRLADLEGAGFNIQPATEKYLEGFLLSRGWALRRIHKLDSLLNDAVIYEPSLEMFRAPEDK
jgi:HEPN domain-containing protein